MNSKKEINLESTDLQEELDQTEYIENKYSAEIQAAQNSVQEEARKRAKKLLEKNKREIKRLKTHAANCLIEGNKTGYKYAIKKLRDFYKQPYTEELIDAMWVSSYNATRDIILKHTE